jgi:N-formylglutamate deformylase
MDNVDNHMPGVLTRRNPSGQALPLMFDSPHSGRIYPTDFNHDCPREKILWGEDSFIDELYGAAPIHGAWLLAAEFPRTYIDPNRALEDMDPTMVDGNWPGEVRDNPKSAEGIGLIWRNAGAGIAFYERKLTLVEAQARIDNYWRHYQNQMSDIAETISDRWGKRWHINCHSMYSNAFAETLGKANVPEEDIILGDRDGSTCSAEFTTLVAEAFQAEGLRVAVNKKFKGVELVRKWGDPANDCHSLQIEIDRRLYMDEWRIEKNAGFDAMQQSVTRVIGKIADYVKSQTPAA